MGISLSDISQFARQLGIDPCLEFDPGLLVPEQRIRDLCHENICGNYGANYMCPPHIGSIDEIKARLGKFQHGILFQYSRPVDVRNRKEVDRIKVDFHRKILQLEGFFKSKGVERVWGLSGGSCGLCEVCKAKVDEPCAYPDEARMSLEALAIDVLSFLSKCGLDNRFYPDKVIWTGCLLF